MLRQPGGSAATPAVVKEVATGLAADGTMTFSEVVFDVAVELSRVDSRGSFVYSYRAHRWLF